MWGGLAWRTLVLTGPSVRACGRISRPGGRLRTRGSAPPGRDESACLAFHRYPKGRGMVNRFAWMAAVGFMFSAPAFPEVNEYQLKAAFLYNFGKFVEWPKRAFNSAADPFAVCVLGEDPFGRSLVDIMNGKALNGRPIQIREVPNVQMGGLCQILFISSSERKSFRSILADLKASPVLTVETWRDLPRRAVWPTSLWTATRFASKSTLRRPNRRIWRSVPSCSTWREL